jgi:hypothetical protein|tara:strand:+ start:146747 stop:147190 length:444 start_codon:yes stop_codon:yes gene_type:complete
MTSFKIGESTDSLSDTQIQQALKLCKDTTHDHVLQMSTTGIDIALLQLDAKREDAPVEELVDINKGKHKIQEKESQVRDRYKRNFEAWFDSGELALVENTWSSGSGALSLVGTESLEQQSILERMAAEFIANEIQPWLEDRKIKLAS